MLRIRDRSGLAVEQGLALRLLLSREQVLFGGEET
jgi:hypothetical protein